jgi:ATP-binding cassette subfamily B multidrug efflux pump
MQEAPAWSFGGICMAKLFRYLTKRQWACVCAALVFIVAQVWLDLKLPDYMSEITTLVETKGSALSDILAQGGYMLLCALGSMAASILVGFLAAKVAAGLARTLRALVYDKTMDFSMEEINRFSSSSLINRCTNDITQVQTLVAMGLQAIVKAPILAVWAVIKIAGKSWQWTTATAAAVLFLCLMLTLTLLFALPRFRRIQGLTDNLNRVTREQLTGIRVVRAFNAESYQEKKFAKANDELTQTNLTANRVMALMSPTMTLINSGLTLAVYWIGAYLIEAADASAKLGIFSDMVVFSSYAMQVILAFMMLNMIFVLLPRAQVSAKRILEVLHTQSRIRDGAGAADTGEHGTVEFRSVSFRYPGAGSDTLTNISFKARRGETVALIGATGSGKTTLLNLIPRFYDATGGQVLVDGADVRDCTQKSLHDRIGYVPQKAVLFSGSVRSNVSYGDHGQGEITDSEVRNAVSVAQGTEFVEAMDGTYDAPIAQGGTNVSGGQKQRLAIARAVARKPEIFLFDDSFSALDYKTDRALRKALGAQTKDATKIIVAQRIGTIRHADRILVLEHGKIVGAGTHEELMKSCPTYQDIAGSQLSKEELQNG